MQANGGRTPQILQDIFDCQPPRTLSVRGAERPTNSVESAPPAATVRQQPHPILASVGAVKNNSRQAASAIAQYLDVLTAQAFNI
jgi:hypothetical protein